MLEDSERRTLAFQQAFKGKTINHIAIRKANTKQIKLM